MQDTASHVGHATAETARGIPGLIVALLPLSLLIYFLTFIGPVAAGDVITFSYPWVPGLDVTLSFYIDGLALLFALIITGIGTLVFTYASGYMAGDRQFAHIYIYLSMFMLSMVGLVIADNIITLFIFWELTSITSYLLIGFKHEYEDSRKSALQALVITGAGGLALLAGLVLLGLMCGEILGVPGGVWELSALFQEESLHTIGQRIEAHALYIPTMILILLGAFTKSAQVPFHFWLPNAMAAPTPISAYLHSATMVKAGVFLLARLSPLLAGTQIWLYAVTIAGAVTMVFGAYQATFQTDLKRILAYTTVSGLGILVFLLGIGTEGAIKGAIVFLVVHALYKGALFMVAGSIDHKTGTRNIDELGGLRHAMPITLAAAVLAALSMSGVPPMLGFVGKEVIYKATTHPEEISLAGLFTTLAVLTKVLTVVAAAIVVVKPFFGEQKHTPKHPHEAPWTMWIGPVILGALSLLLGLLGDTLAQPMVEASMASILAEPAHADLSLLELISHINIVLIMSILTIVVGGAIFFAEQGRLRQIGAITSITWGPERWYTMLFDPKNGAVLSLAKWQTKVIQSGKLRYYMRIVFLTTIGLIGYTLISHVALSGLVLPEMTVMDWGLLSTTVALAVIIVAAALFVVRCDDILSAVAAIGIVGYAVTLIFVLFSAPDLAITQFSIETLTVILFVLVFYRLQSTTNLHDEKLARESPTGRVVDAIIGLAIGGLTTLVMLLITANPLDSVLKPYFLEKSNPEAHGDNVVNVILVDFRAFDTMGEIVVLGVAALGVLALLKLRAQSNKKEEEQ